MKKHASIVFITGFWLSQLLTAQKFEPVDYAKPLLGTEFFGHTFPGPSLPNAMVHLSPDTGTDGWTYCSGYAYSDISIIGFSHTHWSGTGMVNGGDIMLMPAAGTKLLLTPGPPENTLKGYRSEFDHKDEIATPGYYSVFLKDDSIRVELSSTQRAGFHRYTFPATGNAQVILDLGHQLGNLAADSLSFLEFENDSCISGARGSGTGMVYFVAEFSKPFRYYGTFDSEYSTPESGTGFFPYKSAEKGRKIGAFVTFRTRAGEKILVKVGISYTGVEGARKNLQKEIPGWDFDMIKEEARQKWNKELSKIIIEGASEDQKEIFYSALYHSLLAQYISQDIDGKYPGMDGRIHTAKDFDYWGSFSCWDTYRTEHPLLTLISPESVHSILKSIEVKVRDLGWLPAQHFLNVPGQGMAADHLVPVIADAYTKGFSNIDYEFLFNAARSKALESGATGNKSLTVRPGQKYYTEIHYLPVDRVSESVSNTLELGFDDWCLAQMAKGLSKTGDYNIFAERSGYYRNLWDNETKFMRPRKADGSWLEEIGNMEQQVITEGSHSYYRYFDPLLVGRRPNRYYTESNAWQYLWSVQHDIRGLINLFGSRQAFTDKLDVFFNMSPIITPPKYVGVVGTIGQYVHGNQPSHHVAYLYNYAGQPWKSQYRVRQITESLYRTGPGGLCGNEDMGSLSSWYVFSSIGFYPVTPGSQQYVIGSPLFGKAVIDTGNGNTFTVEAKYNSPVNKYIQSASLNGKSISRTWITHKEITAGGRLVFEMGPDPNMKWGSSPEDAPMSLSGAVK